MSDRKAIGHTEDAYNYFVAFDDGSVEAVLKSAVRERPTWRVLAIAAGDTSAWLDLAAEIKTGAIPTLDVPAVHGIAAEVAVAEAVEAARVVDREASEARADDGEPDKNASNDSAGTLSPADSVTPEKPVTITPAEH